MNHDDEEMSEIERMKIESAERYVKWADTLYKLAVAQGLNIDTANYIVATEISQRFARTSITPDRAISLFAILAKPEYGIIKIPPLDDVQALNILHPDTFHIPNAEELATIQTGNFLKVISNKERFWVRVELVHELAIIATVSNTLRNPQPIGFGDTIILFRESIADIEEPGYELTTDNLFAVMKDCIHTAADEPETKRTVKGVKMTLVLSTTKLEENRKKIEDMLLYLPVPFHRDKGGGWTFLKMCDLATGEQWTGLHQDCDVLLILGLAIARVKFLAPRESWHLLPGGMPYIVLMTGKDANIANT